MLSSRSLSDLEGNQLVPQHAKFSEVISVKHIIAVSLVASFVFVPMVIAEQIPFNKDWKLQKFSLFSKNVYNFKGENLEVQSEGSVSMAYRSVPEELWNSSKASWYWTVAQSVSATDLRTKGGDDRNLAIYFVFLPETEAQNLKDAGIRRLLSSNDVRVLVYVWGGDQARAYSEDTPYILDSP